MAVTTYVNEVVEFELVHAGALTVVPAKVPLSTDRGDVERRT